MDWIKTLLFDTESIAHLLLLYSFVIAVGVLLGKLKFRGVSFGVAFILFTGIVVAHFGFTGNIKTISFIQDFGLILFVYSLGLQVGPSFFSSFLKGGVTMNRLAVLLIALNIVVAIGAYLLLFDRTDPDSFPMLVGVLSGAVTNTPGLGAAEEALRQIGGSNAEIANGYACAYPLAVLGVILVPMIVKAICRIRDDKENEQLESMKKEDTSTKPMKQFLEMTNERLEGKTILEIRRLINREFICSRLLHDGVVITPHRDTVVYKGDQLCVVSSEDDGEAIRTLLGKTVEVEWDNLKSTEPLVSRRIVITKEKLNGKTLGQLHLGSIYDVTITRVVRSGTELFASASLVLQIGDRLSVVGKASSVAAVAQRVGNEMKRLDAPNLATLFIGILVGVLFGSIPIAIPGIPTPLKLGLAGGPLVVAILISRFGYKLRLVTYTKASALMMLREVGIALFLASVGIKSGATFVETITSGDGLTFMLAGLLITVIPVFVVALIARKRHNMNYYSILGLVAGASTNPPALAFANSQTEHDAPAVAYSTVYPLTMFLRILTAQLMVLIGCSLF
ncbi:MAG: putative transporter [Bacteroidaceae bacterium]|nr:putative transporter [Bacteroidaceae bacterium]MBR5706547.1 putative transporter [Bacteroidaceae bacterium]